MSILYLEINSVDKKGNIANYRVMETFKDENEMTRWFAYRGRSSYTGDYIPESKNGEISVRYKHLLRYQRLCKDDMRLVEPYTVLQRINGEICLIKKPASYLRRNEVLYDADNDRYLNIMDYRIDIEKHIAKGDGIYISEYECRSRNNCTYYDWGYRHGRTHRKSGNYKHTAMNKARQRDKDKRFSPYDKEELEEFNICCNLPSASRAKLNSKVDDWDEGYSHTENNWKEKRCRYQWQYHKQGNGAFRSEDSKQYKIAILPSFEEMAAIDKAIEEEYDYWYDEEPSPDEEYNEEWYGDAM